MPSKGFEILIGSGGECGRDGHGGDESLNGRFLGEGGGFGDFGVGDSAWWQTVDVRFSRWRREKPREFFGTRGESSEIKRRQMLSLSDRTKGGEGSLSPDVRRSLSLVAFSDSRQLWLTSISTGPRCFESAGGTPVPRLQWRAIVHL